MEDKSVEEKLFNASAKKNGDQYFNIYKLVVEMADRVSARRQTANSFFLSVNTAILTFIGYFKATHEIKYFLILNLAGMLISYTWFCYIRANKQLNTGKFRIIHLIERNLVLKPYDAEWFVLSEGKNKKLYKPFSEIEYSIPWIFFSINGFLLLYQVLKLLIQTLKFFCH